MNPCELVLVRNDRDPRYAICLFQEWHDYTRHVENLKSARKDGEGLGMLRLRRARLNELPAKATASALVGEK
jgi:hypothetical protein